MATGREQQAHRRARAERAARAELDTLAPNDDGLPMPYEGARQLYPTEWRAYRERQARHHEQFPDYAAGWHRPTETTANSIWALVSSAKPDLKIDAFLPGH